MKLSEENVSLFYKLHPALLFYANQQMNISKNVSSIDKLMHLPLKDKVEIRNALFDNINLIDSFIEENPFKFSAEEREIVKGWKNSIKGRFYLLRYLKKYAVFLDESAPPHAYGVVAIFNEFEEIIGSNLPILLETVLLPFKGQIIYDGCLASYRIAFGGGIRRNLNDAYQEAKSRYGIITSLPFSRKEADESDAERLKFYLKSERNRERYSEEIGALINRDSNLLMLYHQEMGKIHARMYGKQLREIGLNDVWFGILQGIIIGSGKTKAEVEQILERILPPEKKDFVYIFHLK